MTTLPANFWAKTRETDCLIWTGAVNTKGYPCFAIDGVSQLAHRLAYEDAHGPIPEDMTVDHKCRVRNCVNPDHLEVVTVGENNRRKFDGGCPNGHAYTPENTAFRKDNGRRICLTCRDATAKRRNKGYGKRGRPSKAAQAALAAELADTA